MKPYYEADGITLYLGDSLEVDKWLEADVLITDPPYGLGGELSLRSNPNYTAHNMFGIQEWDKGLKVRDAVLERWGDKPRAVFGSPRKLEQAPKYRSAPLIWDKGPVAIGDTTFPWKVNYEMIYLLGNEWRMAGQEPSAILRFPHSTQAATQIGHPTPKPVALMRAIMEKSTGTVADPFAGSGSTLLAARDLGRRAIGVELEERYAEVAAKRLEQGILFATGS